MLVIRRPVDSLARYMSVTMVSGEASVSFDVDLVQNAGARALFAGLLERPDCSAVRVHADSVEYVQGLVSRAGEPAAAKPSFEQMVERARQDPGAPAQCTYALAAAGKGYPRTCRECGLGPCRLQG